MKTVLLFLLITGIVLFYYDRTHTPPPVKIEYRYIPRNWIQQLEDNAFSKDEIFQQMYDSESGNVWLQAYQGKKLV
jgi:DNA-binding GntR family transcriptional regulator